MEEFKPLVNSALVGALPFAPRPPACAAAWNSFPEIHASTGNSP